MAPHSLLTSTDALYSMPPGARARQRGPWLLPAAPADDVRARRHPPFAVLRSMPPVYPPKPTAVAHRARYCRLPYAAPPILTTTGTVMWHVLLFLAPGRFFDRVVRRRFPQVRTLRSAS